MFVTNPVTSDPRVKREATALVKGGYGVVIIGLQAGGDSREEWIDGYQIIRSGNPELLSMRQAILAILKWLSPHLHDSIRKFYRIIRYGSKVEIHPPLVQVSQTAAPLGTLTLRQRLQADQLAIRYIFWLNVAMAKVAVEQGVDIFHSHDLDTLLAGYLAKRWTGKPLLYDFHELYTQQFKKGFKSPLWHLWYTAVEWILVKQADFKLTVCDSLGEWVARRYGVTKAITVMNVPECKTHPTVRLRQSGTKIILYHGGYLKERGLECLIESARYLKGGKIVLRGFGPLESELRTLVQAKGVDELVSFSPPVSVAELVKAASEADIGIVPYVPVCLNNRFCLPNKIFEYMMAGLAIVGSDLPELRRIILGNDLGRVYDPDDPRVLARVLNELLADASGLEKMRRNALRAAQETYNWANESQKLLRLYDAALGIDRPGVA